MRKWILTADNNLGISNVGAAVKSRHGGDPDSNGYSGRKQDVLQDVLQDVRNILLSELKRSLGMLTSDIQERQRWG